MADDIGLSDWVYMYETKVLKVSPFGDVAVSVCRGCGAIVAEEELHYAWHRKTGTDQWKN